MLEELPFDKGSMSLLLDSTQVSTYNVYFSFPSNTSRTSNNSNNSSDSHTRNNGNNSNNVPDVSWMQRTTQRGISQILSLIGFQCRRCEASGCQSAIRSQRAWQKSWDRANSCKLSNSSLGFSQSSFIQLLSVMGGIGRVFWNSSQVVVSMNNGTPI